MGNVERFGLLALFILCALIVGVGIFGSDRTSVPRFEKAKIERSPQPVPRDKVARHDDWDGGRKTVDDSRVPDDLPRNGLRPVRRERDEPRDLPSPNRTESFKVEPLRITPPAPAPRSEPAAASLVEYVVKQNDSIWRIAKVELGSPSTANMDAIRAANPGMSDELTRGQKIFLPRRGAVAASAKRRSSSKKSSKAPARGAKTRSYTVKAGESLWRIAQKELGSASKKNIQRIRDANPSIRNDRIDKGQVLRLPVASSR